MLEILLTAAIAGTVFWLSARGHAPGRFAHLSKGLGREHVALTLIILASHSRVARAGAEDTLSNPFTIEVVLRGVFVLAAIAILLPAARNTIRLASTIRRSWWGIGSLVVYAASATLSVLYSPALLQTAGKALEFASLVLLVWHLASRRDAADALARTLYAVIAIELALLAASAIGFFAAPGLFAPVLTRPGFFFQATLEGPLGSANDTSSTGGTMVAIAAAAWLSKTKDNRSYIWPLMAAVGLVAVALSSGRQGVAIMVAAVALAVWATNRQGFYLMLVPALTAAVLFAGSAILEILLRDQVAGSVRTLTGRTKFWEAAIDAFAAQPLTGYGFGSSRFAVLANIDSDRFTHLHNGYLESLVGVGLLGFIPFMVMVVVAAAWAIRCFRTGRHVALAVIVPALLAQTLIAQGIGGWLNTNLVLFSLLVALADVHRTAPGSGRLLYERDGATFSRR
ncbi:MAG: O-antigen ligase family protein [Acidimicrobiia bacterium]|nr:O-antigen ligase family protein [Acidimicrobiia bacterium]MDH4306855.1 O-antigen ligase family protein [Acidimicrobiia bacterium]MDH5294270.1 O-antigen ligase family protein [Acidimicrobiia bacterium]